MKNKQQLVESGMKKVFEKLLSENYYANELNRVTIDPVYSPTIKITNGNGLGTKTLNINRESLPILIKWLKSIEKQLPQ